MASIDLLTPIVPEKAWHPNFAALIARGNKWNSAVLNDWSEGLVDRDGKFAQEFQTTFNACFWELYLNAVLRKRGLTVNFDSPSPDFAVTAPWSLTIEAVIASHAHGSLPEYRSADAQVPDDLNELNREAILRLSNALHSKYKMYMTHYAAKPHVSGRPFVIALAPFDRPHFTMSCQRAIEALLFNYYVDEDKYTAAGQPDSPISKTTLQAVRKDNGAAVELGLFQSNAMQEVSAVVFSTCATWGKLRALSDDPNPNIFFTALRLNPQSSMPHKITVPKREYRESLLDGLRVYHNPYALHPLDPAVFRSDEVFQSYWCRDIGDWVYEQKEGQLLFRTVFTHECEG